MWEITLAFIIGFIFGIVIMALSNISAESSNRIITYRLYISLHNLHTACYQAAMEGELSKYIDGEYLEAAHLTLEEFDKEH